MRSLARYNRFGSLLPEVDDFFRSFSNLYDTTNKNFPLEMYEENGELFVNIDIPGFKPEDVEIRVFEDRLQICSKTETEEKSETPAEGEENRSYYYRLNRRNVNYRIGLPSEVDADNVSAKFENGVIKLRMAKKKKEEGRIVEIGQ